MRIHDIFMTWVFRLYVVYQIVTRGIDLVFIDTVIGISIYIYTHTLFDPVLNSKVRNETTSMSTMQLFKESTE